MHFSTEAFLIKYFSSVLCCATSKRHALVGYCLLFQRVLDHLHAKNSHTQFQVAQLLENPPSAEYNTIQNNKSLLFDHFLNISSVLML